MLVISREPKQQIAIGDDITVEVVRIRHGRVQIGVVAPQDVRIRRLPEHGAKRLTCKSEGAILPAAKEAVDLD